MSLLPGRAAIGQALHPILIRGLKRSFVIAGDWSNSALAALQTTPDLLQTEPIPEEIIVAPAGPHYRMPLPSGQMLEGSLRDCATQLDMQLLHQAIANEGEALVLSAA